MGRLLGRSYRHRVVAVVGVGLVGRLSLLDLVHILVASHLVLLVLHLWGRHIVLTKGGLIQLGLCIAGAQDILAAKLLTVVVRLGAAQTSWYFLWVIVVEDGVSWVGNFLQ